jgi:TPR repeat
MMVFRCAACNEVLTWSRGRAISSTAAVSKARAMHKDLLQGVNEVLEHKVGVPPPASSPVVPQIRAVEAPAPKPSAPQLGAITIPAGRARPPVAALPVAQPPPPPPPSNPGPLAAVVPAPRPSPVFDPFASMVARRDPVLASPAKADLAVPLASQLSAEALAARSPQTHVAMPLELQPLDGANLPLPPASPPPRGLADAATPLGPMLDGATPGATASVEPPKATEVSTVMVSKVIVPPEARRPRSLLPWFALLFAAAAVAVWWFLGRGPPAPVVSPDPPKAAAATQPPAVVTTPAPDPPPPVAPVAPVVLAVPEKPVPVKPAPTAKGMLGGVKVVLENETPKQPEDQAAVERARAMYRSGNVKLIDNDAEGAVQAYLKALEIYPGFAVAYRGLGQAYGKQGDNAKALVAYGTYLEAVPRARDVTEIRKRMAALAKPAK